MQACGLIISGMGDAKSLATAQRICVMMGEYFQIQVSGCSPLRGGR